MTTPSAAPAPFSKPQWFDGNGNPLSGGLLYTYTAGTVSQTPSYQDALMGAENTNPVVLDAAGRADVYLNPAQSYHIVLTDSLGNVIFDEDNQYVAPPSLGGSSLTPIYTTTDQSANGTKVFQGNVAIGQGVVSEYSSAPIQLIVGAAASTTSGIQFVNTTTTKLQFGTAETGVSSYNGAIGFNNTSNTMTFGIANAGVLVLTASGVNVIGTLQQGGVNVALSTDLIPLTRGGTGVTTAAAAINELLPAQTGNSGKYLSTDGTNPEWLAPPTLSTLVNGTGTDRVRTNNNTADPDLSVILAAGHTYTFTICAEFYSPGAGVFIGVGFTGTASKGSWGGVYNTLGSGGFTQGFALNVQTNIFTDGIDQNSTITIQGNITTTTEGTLSLNWGNGSSGSNNMTRYGGCGIIATLVN